MIASYMDELIFWLLAGIFSVILALIFRDIILRHSEMRAEERLAKTGYYKAIGARGLEARYGKKESEETEEEPIVGKWVEDLETTLGFPFIDSLFEDEMPEPLKRALPAIKGFIEGSGGIDKILGRLQKQEPGEIQPGPDGTLYL